MNCSRTAHIFWFFLFSITIDLIILYWFSTKVKTINFLWNCLNRKKSLYLYQKLVCAVMSFCAGQSLKRYVTSWNATLKKLLALNKYQIIFKNWVILKFIRFLCLNIKIISISKILTMSLTISYLNVKNKFVSDFKASVKCGFFIEIIQTAPIEAKVLI